MMQFLPVALRAAALRAAALRAAASNANRARGDRRGRIDAFHERAAPGIRVEGGNLSYVAFEQYPDLNELPQVPATTVIVPLVLVVLSRTWLLPRDSSVEPMLTTPIDELFVAML